MTDKIISERAVLKAAQALWERSEHAPWASASESFKEPYIEEAHVALESAAPHILVGAWDAGAVAGWRQSGEGFNSEYPDESTGACSVDLSANPYRRDQ